MGHGATNFPLTKVIQYISNLGLQILYKQIRLSVRLFHTVTFNVTNPCLFVPYYKSCLHASTVKRGNFGQKNVFFIVFLQ